MSLKGLEVSCAWIRSNRSLPKLWSSSPFKLLIFCSMVWEDQCFLFFSRTPDPILCDLTPFTAKSILEFPAKIQ